MMDPQLLAAAADLCGLRLTPSERASLTADLAQLLGLFASLQSVDTSNVDPPEPCQGRAVSPASLDETDQPQPCASVNELLGVLGPHNGDGLLIAPKVMELQPPTQESTGGLV
ncbi:MAG: aspartyl/glutamyl-tRNA(Asn/Gln) amidotransferase C subunit [Pseudohongiellaceae bacterium]|jgi:aspartyl/glutamyl-tRNA(Asn/Gln) amidotransferase C subunit